MKILKAKYILTCDESFKILQNHAIIFDDKIQKIQPISQLKIRSNDEIINVPLAMPALINAHTHLEYSANKAYLDFNGFTNWLKSVFLSRGILAKKLSAKILQNQINKMLKSGVGCVGEYSSFGLDLELLAASPLRARFYCEILGTNENFLENSWANFLNRFKQAQACQSPKFGLGVAVHSPYSTHKILAFKAINLAKELNLPLSAHFAESKDELDFLNGENSDLKGVLEMINPKIQALYSPDEFLKMFDKENTLFIHCVHAEKYLANIAHIAHCPRSNRFLSQGILPLLKAKKHANIALGTDGLSSNYNLDIWDEMRAALMIHANADINELSKLLLCMATSGGAKALKINSGEIKIGKNADIATFALPAGSKIERLAPDLILHTKKAKSLFIGGKKIF